jgi:hypothetical protein
LRRFNIRRYLRRFGCGVLLVLWFTLLTAPCWIAYLVTEREIVLAHSDIPNDNFRIWLVQDVRHRGIAVSNTRRVDAANGVVCTILDGHFFMWEGSVDQPPHYCSCFTRQDKSWSSVAEGPEACQMAGQ